MAPFAALPDLPTPEAWDDLAAMTGPAGAAVLFRAAIEPGPGWSTEWSGAGVQLVAERLAPLDDPGADRLSLADAPEMLDLVARTRPGPFSPRTPVLGNYLGIRDADGALVAMAGERLHPEGYSEISAVCTDPAHRGEGLATRLVRAMAALIIERGETPFLHAAESNTGAIRLYLSLGFAHRRQVVFSRLRAPEG